jgi:5-methyltetrahydrofolate--homocysteine methyltransferase
MIDSSRFELLEGGLNSIQGKHIVNFISFKEGEKEFVQKPRRSRFLVQIFVMAFDEEGRLGTFARKEEVCKRAYNILVHKVDFSPQDI